MNTAITTIKVLLVEDDEDDYRLTSDLLSEIYGPRAEIEWIASYSAALDRLKNTRFDIYLFDYRLGERSGLDLLTEAIALTIPEPIILLTGQGTSELGREAMRRGAADFLIKGNVNAPILERSIDFAVQRKEFQQTLQRQAITFNSIQDSVFATNMDGEILDWNPAAERLFGYSKAEAVGRNSNLLYKPEIAGTIALVISEGLQRGGSWTGEINYLRKDGSASLGQTIVSLMRDDQGHPTGMLNVNHDITENRLAEEALNQSEKRLVEAQKIAQVGSWEWDLVSDEAIGSAEMLRLLGLQPLGSGSRFTIQSFIDCLLPEDREWVQQTLARAVDERGSIDYENRIVHPDGTVLILHGLGKVVVDDAGQPVKMVGTARDITESKQAEEARIARHAAERANHAKSEFLSRMSHELRTPLNSILGFGQLMEMQDPSPDQAESIDHILKSGKHLLNLIDEVLEISRIEANHLTLSLEPVLLDSMIDDAIQLVGISATQRGIQISRGAGENLSVLADVQRLKQVLLNLLSNAIKYNSERGTILVKYCQRADGLIRVSVTDSGNGIPEEHLPLLFSPFERLGAEQTGVQGTGLGLAVSKSLIEAMSGVMGVQSESGGGSTFWFDLAETEPHSKIVSETIINVLTHAEPITQKMTLLCIEDNQANLTLMERIMRRWPLPTLIPAMEGRIGIELAHQHQPDLILLDLHLPDIMGDEVLRELKSDPDTAHIPVIVVSADASQKQIERLIGAGAQAYVTKPIDVRKFIELVEGISTEKVPSEI